MAFHQINGIRIRTDFEYPPIPVRSFDWSAVDDDTYDCDCDQDGFFTSCPIGHGETEQAAIEDLLEQIEDRREERTEAAMKVFDETIANLKHWVEGPQA